MLFRGQQQAQGQVSYCKMKGQPCYFEDSAISGTVLFRGQVSYYKVSILGNSILGTGQLLIR
jgi:hypothetical protein